MTDVQQDDLRQQNATKETVRWKFIAVVFAYTIILKILPYVLYNMGMDVEKNFTIYPWNFSPIFALGMFGGAMYRSKANALWLPVAAIFLADLGIGLVTGHPEWAFYSDQPVVYTAFALCAVLGFYLRENRSWGRVAGAGVASCLSFFLITNFASWVGSTRYPPTAEGLLECYIAGLPFLKNSLIATAIFGGLLFSPAAILQTSPQEAQQELVPATTAG